MFDLAEYSERLSDKLSPSTRLSEHFKASELSCACCGRVFISPVVLEMLERLREKLGCAILLNPREGMGSGYRCPAHNSDIRGATHSRHCLGLAVDVPLPTKYLHLPEEFAFIVESVARQVRGGFHYYPENRFAHMDAWAWPPNRRW